MMLLSDYVRFYGDILSDELCDEVINFYENNLDLEFGASVGGSEKVKLEERNSKIVPIPASASIDSVLCDAVTKTIMLYIDSVTQSFINGGSDSDFVRCFPKEFTSDTFLINKYSQGEYYKWHCDQSFNPNQGSMFSRVFSILFYLNDDFEGGETKFLFGEIKPKKGACLVFPSNFIYPHYSLSVTKGVKYSLATWLSPRINTDGV